LSDSRFEGDVLPDSTWGICKIHSPSGIVRLVDESGRPAVNGVCQTCWEESRDDSFFCCPVGNFNPKAPGREGCPVADCLGAGAGPTEDEIAREAESIGRVWPGGPAIRQDVLDAAPSGPARERDREALEAIGSEPGRPARHDGPGSEEGPAWRDPFLNP